MSDGNWTGTGTGTGTRARWLGLALAGMGSLACAPNEAKAPPERAAETRVGSEASSEVEASSVIDPRELARLEGAVLEASYATDTLVELLASLPRPTPTESSLVALVGGILDAVADTSSDRLEQLGLRPGARVFASARPLDDRGPALRKRLAETMAGERDSEAWISLEADARSLGLHVRASLPTTAGERVLQTLQGVRATPRASGPVDPGLWAEACAALGEPELCGGWPQLLVWARPVSPETVRVDAVYLFYPARSEADEAARVEAIRRAQDWPRPAPDRLARDRPSLGPGPMTLRLLGQPMLELLEAEALADVVVELGRARGEAAEPERWTEYLDRERALREILAGTQLFDGLRVDLDYAAETDALRLELGWLPTTATDQARAEMFAPVDAVLGLPRLETPCADALACGRIGGLSSMARFAELAGGPYADLTGVTRVMRQAGDRGSILLLLAAWPRLLGTAGAMASGGRGLLGSAQSELASGSAGLGFVVDALEVDARRSRGLGYLRVAPSVVDALGPAATLAGLRLQAIDLAGAERAERGRYEDVAVYMIEGQAPDEGAWIIVVDDCEARCSELAEARVEALLASARDTGEVLDPLAQIEIGALGSVAAYEGLDESEDPPLRTWLDRHRLELAFRFAPSGPQLELVLEPR